MGQFHRGVVTTYALEVGVAADCDDGDQSLSAFLAARCSIHEMILPDYSSLTRNGNLCSRTLRPNAHFHLSSSGCTGRASLIRSPTSPHPPPAGDQFRPPQANFAMCRRIRFSRSEGSSAPSRYRPRPPVDDRSRGGRRFSALSPIGAGEPFFQLAWLSLMYSSAQ